MKSILAVVFSVLLAVHAHADPPAKIDGVAGIPFGATADDVKTAMDSRGAKFHPGVSTGAILEFEGGTFNNEGVKYWRFYFTDSKLFKASVNIAPPDSKRLETYERIKKQLSEKYGQPFQETKLEMDPAQLYDLVRSGKTALETNWREAEPACRSIYCKLFRFGDTVTLRIGYQDDVIEAQTTEKQRNDL